MDDILKGVADFIAAGDTEKKFKAVYYSEYLDECIAKNKTPFINIIGPRKRRFPLQGFSFNKSTRRGFDISIVIVQDAKLMKKVVHGSDSIWSLEDYLWDIIDADQTFGGIVRAIDEKPIESKLVMITKDNSIKLGLEIELTLTKDVFK